MMIEDSQCAAYVTEFGSQSVNTALRVVQGVISLLSIIGQSAVDFELRHYCSGHSEQNPDY